ncbi:hypothetical protein [Streptomyces sp. NPDC048142]|uniref:hypothetical protein n=1 Tax=Streptomyces sp. NPDC048142 TaxID=3365501 RepID=UPI003714FF54
MAAAPPARGAGTAGRDATRDRPGHADGRIRQAAPDAVRAAPELRPLLVVRCADWVPPVRERSRTLLAELPGSALIPLAELIPPLSRRARGGFARALLEDALREGPAADVPALTAHRSCAPIPPRIREPPPGSANAANARRTPGRCGPSWSTRCPPCGCTRSPGCARWITRYGIG